MSRILVFDRWNRQVDEFSAVLNRGWMLTGHPSVSGGGETSLSLTEENAIRSSLQFGRLIYAAHPKLPAWAGMLDTPWNASLPVSAAVYNAEYLLSLRAPENPVLLKGTVGEIAAQMLEKFNERDDLFVRIGETSQADQTQREETLDSRSYWDQLKALLERAGCEMQTRAELDADGRLFVYVDIAKQIGVDSGFLYADGEHGNAIFSDIVMDGIIVNRAIGISDQSSQQSRLQSPPFQDDDSIEAYRLRSDVVQFENISIQSTLDKYTEYYVQSNAQPRMEMQINILDKGDAFANARLGNRVQVHISEAFLPGGVQGLRGTARILALAYGEDEGILSAKAELMI